MNELDDLKKHATERRAEPTSDLTFDLRAAEADLDRAIAIAEEQQRDLDEMTGGMWSIDHTQLIKERDKARAAALMLRDALNLVIGGWVVVPLKRQFEKTLADTEWIEKYR